jgi:hypothetical protein
MRFIVSCVSIISIHHQLLAGICCHDMKAFFPWTQLLCNVAETPSFLVGVAKGGPGSLSFGRNLQVKTQDPGVLKATSVL